MAMKRDEVSSQDLVLELAWLKAENARLAGLLDAHGIAWRHIAPEISTDASPANASNTSASLTTQER